MVTFRLVGWATDADGCKSVLDIIEWEPEKNPFRKDGKLYAWAARFLARYSNYSGPSWDLTVKEIDAEGFDQFVPYQAERFRHV